MRFRANKKEGNVRYTTATLHAHTSSTSANDEKKDKPACAVIRDTLKTQGSLDITGTFDTFELLEI